MFTGKKMYWWFQLAGWTGLFLLHVFFAWYYGQFETSEGLKLYSLRSLWYVIIGISTTHLMRAVIKKFSFPDRSFKIQIAGFLSISLITALTCTLIELLVFRQAALFTSREREIFAFRGIPWVLLYNTIGWFFYIFIWNAIYMIYHYTRDQRQQQLDTLQLKSLVRELELKTIKANINPHFIFNALNSIRALVDENPARARTAITELSNILRNSITMHKTDMVALKNELNVVKDYLALEKVRFEERLNIIYEIDEESLDKQIPPMILQTLVENAIKHGISKELKGGEVFIGAHIHHGNLELSVKNTGRHTAKENETGFGLASIQDRLKILYPGKSSFTIQQSENNTVVSKIILPI